MFLKRIFDLIAASIGLVVLFPFIVLLVIAVMIDLGWPIFYRAERAGRGGAAFKILKFRSMRPAGPGEQTHHSGEDDPRISRVGKFMRRYKFDELPQLWNVIIGNMSLVGPRPETLEYTKLYTEEQMEILSVRPGITDWASLWNADEGAILSGADDPDKVYMEEIRPGKLRLQMEYVNKRSLWIDFKIIVQTISTILGFPPKNMLSNTKRT